MSEALRPIPPVQQCSYCGQNLRPNFYFCPSCSRPWRSGEVGLGPAPEPAWDDETLIRKRAPQAYNLFLWYLAAIIGAAIIGYTLGRGKEATLNTLVLTSIAVSVTTLIAAIRYGDVLRGILRKPGVNHSAFAIALPIAIVLLGLNHWYHDLLEQVLHHEPGSREETEFMTRLPLAGSFVLWCLLPAVTEEIGFRGLMQTFLLRALTPRKAIFVSSLLFAAAHLSILSFPYLFLVGALLGWLFQKTGSVYPGMIIHAAHNFAVIVCFS